MAKRLSRFCKAAEGFDDTFSRVHTHVIRSVRTVVNVENVDLNVFLSPQGDGAVDVPKTLKHVREGLGLSMDKFAKQIGLAGGSSYQRYEDPERYKSRPFLDAALAKRIWALIQKSGRPVATENEILALAGFTESSVDSTSPNGSSMTISDVAANARIVGDAPPMFTSRQDLPILGHTKAGSEALFIDNGVRSGMEYRPPQLVGIDDAYAVEVHGDSMLPRLEQGWLLFVHPRKALRAGRDVVVQMSDGRALIKTLVRLSDSEVILRQYHPEKDIRLKRSDVAAIHLVVGVKV